MYGDREPLEWRKDWATCLFPRWPWALNFWSSVSSLPADYFAQLLGLDCCETSNYSDINKRCGASCSRADQMESISFCIQYLSSCFGCFCFVLHFWIPSSTRYLVWEQVSRKKTCAMNFQHELFELAPESLQVEVLSLGCWETVHASALGSCF